MKTPSGRTQFIFCHKIFNFYSAPSTKMLCLPHWKTYDTVRDDIYIHT